MLCWVQTMLISALIPGASYAAGAFTIPWASLNSLLTNQVTAADSAERLILALAQVIQAKQDAGTIQQYNFGAEVSSKSISKSTWEASINNFSDVTVVSYLLSFNLGTTAFLEDADSAVSA